MLSDFHPPNVKIIESGSPRARALLAKYERNRWMPKCGSPNAFCAESKVQKIWFKLPSYIYPCSLILSANSFGIGIFLLLLNRFEELHSLVQEEQLSELHEIVLAMNAEDEAPQVDLDSKLSFHLKIRVSR